MAARERLMLQRTTRQKLAKHLRQIPKEIVNPDQRSNLGQQLFDIFCWQEVKSMADTELKHAWKKAQSDEGICDVDDVLREEGVGEFEICNSRTFAMIAEIKTPAQRVDEVAFYKKLAKKFQTSVAAIERMADSCKVDNKAALTKRVVERV